MAQFSEGVRLEAAPQDIVTAIIQMTKDKSSKPEDTLPYWVRMMAEVRGNGYTKEQLQEILKLVRTPYYNPNNEPISEPFVQEVVDLSLKTHDLASGKLAPPQSTKLGYFHWANSSLYFLSNGSGTYKQDEVKQIDSEGYWQAVTNSCRELYLSEPPLKSFYGDLGELLMKDICRRQLGIILSRNGVRLN